MITKRDSILRGSCFCKKYSNYSIYYCIYCATVEIQILRATVIKKFLGLCVTIFRINKKEYLFHSFNTKVHQLLKKAKLFMKKVKTALP